ncbi:MAG: hypothetical protein PVH52_00560 [bacterium]|jgi:hypothetical protein
MRSFSTIAIILGIAFLASGLLRLAMRSTFDPDIIVGLVFLVSGLITRVAKK